MIMHRQGHKKSRRILPGLEIQCSDDGGDHYLHYVDIGDEEHIDYFSFEGTVLSDPFR